MATQVQQRRGTTAQHNVFTGANGELTVDTSKDTLVIHDGTTQGGFPLARESDIPTGALASLNSVGASQIDADAITDAKVADNALSGDKIDGGTISNFTSTGIDDNATSTKLTISDTTITGVGAFTSTSIDATKLSGALPAIDGSNLTGIEAVIKQTTKPTGQSVGTFWFDTDDKILHIHDGSDFVQVYETSNNGTSALPFTSAWESKQLGAANGNYYVMINGTKRHVYINNSDYDGAWILVTRAKSNSNAHHGGGGSGGNSSPINPSSSSAHDYSDSFINEIFAARAYNGSNSGCTWRAYANNRGNMFGYATSANFCSDCQADGSGWDLVNGSYSSSYNVNLGGNSGSRGFGDHHANGSFFAYNRHNSNSGFAHDNMSNSDGVFYIRN